MSAYRQLSDTQQIALIILPIPSAIISILGSAAIIYLAKERRQVQPWTPYTRLLVAMSICDIVFSLNVGVSTFLRPKETSYRIWAFGNDSTCSFVAFINQASSAGGMCYNGMLSFYFLLTARYGMKNSKISRCIEPLMHLLALGFSIGTAIVGAIVDIYGEKAGAMSCWMSRKGNDNKSYTEKETERDIKYDLIGTIFFALPVLAVFICLVTNNIVIFLFMRRHTRKSPFQETEDSTRSHEDIVCDRLTISMEPSQTSSIIASNTKTTASRDRENKEKKSKRNLARQAQRLQLVSSQAFLFVSAFVMCNVWNFVLGTLQGGNEDVGTMVKYYPLAVVQAALLPLQGLFNMIIFLRPKYLKLRDEFPSEGSLWTMRRVFLGKHLCPTASNGCAVDGQVAANPVDVSTPDPDAAIGDIETSKSAATGKRFPRSAMSSLTASDVGIDGVADDPRGDERWHDASVQVNQGSPTDLAVRVSRLTTLEAISELAESVFDLDPYQANGSHLSLSSVGLAVPTEPSASRWKGVQSKSTHVTTLRSSAAAEESGSDLGEVERRACMNVATMEAPERLNPDAADLPIELPRRRGSPFSVQRPRIYTPRCTDSPISVPKRTLDAPMDSPTVSPSSSSDSTVLVSKKMSYPHLGLGGNRVSDIPLAPPERFTSLPPSEVEEE